MSLYDDLFSQFNQPIAQILLTKNDLADVSNYPSTELLVNSDPRISLLLPPIKLPFGRVIFGSCCYFASALTLLCWYCSSTFREHNI